MTTTTTLRQRLGGWPGGVVLMVVGAALALAGLLQTTSSTPNPNADCPDGSVLVAKFNYSGHSYSFDKPSGNGSVVSITNGSATGGTWSSTTPISAYIVKGGPNSLITSLSPAQTSGSFSNAGLPKVGAKEQNLPDISNVQFCGPDPAATTTTMATTTTAAPTTTSTTTTAPAATTTVDEYTPTTSTTAPPATTITIPETTTTARATTTTNWYDTTEAPTTTAPVTTTVPGETTTSAPSVTTTTTVAGATTTTVSGTTTTVEVEGTSQTAVTSTTIVPDTAVLGEALPRTGSSSTPLLTAGLALFLCGVALTIVGVRRGRR
jgi:hypothetical protein